MTVRSLSGPWTSSEGVGHFRVRSPHCIAHRFPVPSEPHRPVNPDRGCNGWRVIANNPPPVGQALKCGESMDQEKAAWVLVGTSTAPRAHGQNYRSVAGKVPVGNICRNNILLYPTREKQHFRVLSKSHFVGQVSNRRLPASRKGC